MTARSVLLVLALVAIPLGAHAGPAKVAVAKVKGSKKANPAGFESGLVKGLKAAGVTTIGVAAVRPGTPSFTAPAEEAGADFLVVTEVRYAKKKRSATVRLFTAEGEELKSVRTSYRKPAGAKAAAAKVGKQLGAIAAERAAEAEAAAAAAAEQPRVVAPVVPKDEAPPPPAPVATAAVPKDEAPEAEVSRRRSSSGLGDKEDGIVRLSVGVGTQMGSAYTVAVGGDVTGLAYTLSPLLLVTAHVVVRAPRLGLGGEVWTSFVPVKFVVDVDPPVDPNEPSGRFFDVGGAVSYRLNLTDIGTSGGLYLTPLVGAEYASMTAQGQGENTVVVSYSGINVQGGLRIGVAPMEDLVFELEGRGGLLLSYSEGPTTTGEGGSGFIVRVGGQVRYWFTDMFGAYVNAGYSYQRVGLTGTGTRVAFQEDPTLLDATVFNGDFKLSTGLHVSL
ncbi:MAG: hypothetical protein H6730_07790 [Deltaproteobacteria bacterium]|nr:hypothetical protein [Deltaproteobacteria bacterium]